MTAVPGPTGPGSQSGQTGAGGRGGTAGRVAGIDGLRGCAVAAVVLFHLGLLPGGFLGVDVFFVLSGFLITRLVLAEVTRTGTVSLRRFYLRRSLRLYPALIVMVTFCLAGTALLGHGQTAAALRDALVALTYVANVVPPTTGLLDHTWTLALEEQFYLLWPVLLLLSLRRNRSGWRWVPAAAVVGTVLVVDRVSGHHGVSATYVRAMGLPIGCALALAPASATRALARLGPACAVVLALLLAVPVPASLTTGWPVGVGAVVTAPVVAMITSRSLRALETPVLRWLGTRSYSLYLWHFPLLSLAEHQAGTAVPVALRVTAGLAASLISAEASYRLVEQPVLRRRDRGRDRGRGRSPVAERPVASTVRR